MAIAMTDRLSALKHQGSRSDFYRHGAEEDGEADDGGITELLLTAGETTKLITTIKTKIDQVHSGHNTMLTSFNNQAAKQNMETLNEEIKGLSHKVHAQLKRMKVDIEAGEKGPDRNSADFRIRKAQFHTLSRLFKEAMEDYNKEQESYRDKTKERIMKQMHYAGQRVTEEKLETMLESDDPQIFTQDIVLLTAQKRAALGECEARHKEILALEQNIRELHDMFYDMALLVDEQGELIDRIERNVENASVYVYHGQRQLKKAVSVQRTGRRTKWIICIVLICCCSVLIIGGAIAGVVVYLLVS